ncbi:LysR substrate-binding domain-containing protein [Sphingobium sp. B7D2B]|uniref:LysR substrate-binding domain-containing protein n=1 Tax=Sphingobium sp. B7D2B TaxID=2940583 RepID=UPI0039B5CD87
MLGRARRSDLRSTTLFGETFACLFDQPSDGDALTLEEYLARPHVRVTVALQDDSEIDDALARLGHKRRIAVQVPHWSTAPELIMGTDLILTAARRSIEHLGYGHCSALRFRLNSFPFVQTWHRRRYNDPAHRWLRAQIEAIAGGPEGGERA